MRHDKECIVTEPKAVSLIKEWSNRLNLNDWAFYLYYTNSNDENVPKTINDKDQAYQCRAWCGTDFHTKKATIGLVKPSDKERKSANSDPRDMEKSLVHELVHIPFAIAMQTYEAGYNDMNESQIIALEQQINAIADALVNAKRLPK